MADAGRVRGDVIAYVLYGSTVLFPPGVRVSEGEPYLDRSTGHRDARTLIRELFLSCSLSFPSLEHLNLPHPTIPNCSLPALSLDPNPSPPLAPRQFLNMVSLWGSKKDDDAEGTPHAGGPSVQQPRLVAEADERTRLLPPPTHEGYLSPDDPAVSLVRPWLLPKLPSRRRQFHQSWGY